MIKSILLFADRLPPLIGGMEMHAGYFIQHFKSHRKFPLVATIARTEDLDQVAEALAPHFIFFNSGYWIEELDALRQRFPRALFVYRTGGNEIVKAPLVRNFVASHSQRQLYWAETLNRTIDLLITNSAFTETRLRNMGIQCPFKRFVGGVNVAALQPTPKPHSSPFTIFCAARFVPYKNHVLLISIVHALKRKGHELCLRLAGDGPLLDTCRKQVEEYNLNSLVTFLGPLDNEACCYEIASADLYMQLSQDLVTEVPGGSYVHTEGMGRSILEAIAAGTFVVAGHSGALPEIITPDRGLLVDLNDPETIIDHIENLISSPPLKRAPSYQFDWKSLFKGYEDEIFARH